MGVGPPGRTGRHQLDQVRALLDGPELEPGGVVALLCARGAGILGPGLKVAGAVVCEVDCTGSLHTSAIEFLVRGGFAGVIVFACPPRDCANREGAKWLEAWMYHDREAELRARVDRRRVALAFVGAGERRESVRALREFQAAVAALDRPVAEVGLEADAVCEAAAEEVVEA
jgi:coenzyme F420-reducing hydrogenase delta subunit